MPSTRRRFLRQVAGGAALPALAPVVAREARADVRAQMPSTGYEYLGRMPDYRDWEVVPRGLTVRSVETFQRRP